MTYILRQGLVVGSTSTKVADVLVRDGLIVEVAEHLAAPAGALEIDAEGCWVGPGFVDLHTHLREPGREAAETVESGARAGAVGGYSVLVAMPNTEPALDNVALVSHVQQVSTQAVDGLSSIITTSPVLAGSATAAMLLALLAKQATSRPTAASPDDFDAPA